MNRIRKSRCLDVYDDILTSVDATLGVPFDECQMPNPKTTPPLWRPKSVRGAPRGENRARAKREKILNEALVERKYEIGQHTKWLQSSGKRIINERTEYLKVWDRPEAVPGGATKFRREVHKKREDSKLPNRVSASGTGASFIVLRQPSFEEAHSLNQYKQKVCSAALISTFASAHLRYETKAATVAATLGIIYARHNRLPGHGRIMSLLAHLRATAAQNPNPANISRSQFTRVAVAALDGLSMSTAHLLFASFDPEHTDRVHCGAIIAALLAGHRTNNSIATLTKKQRGINKHLDIETETMLRHAVAAYDPEDDGIEQFEIIELISGYATSHDSHVAMIKLLEATDWTNALQKQNKKAGLQHGRLRSDDFIELLSNQPGVLQEFLHQLHAFREKLQAAQIAQERARTHSVARANKVSYSFSPVSS